MPVPAPAPDGIVDLDQAKEHLHIDEEDTSRDARLQMFIDAATSVIEHIVGAVVPVEVTKDIPANGRVLILPHDNIVSITSVNEYTSGTATEITEDDVTSPVTYGYTLDGSLLSRWASGSATTWTSGSTVRVVYVAGMSPIPAAIMLAALELIQHWWTRSQGSGSEAYPEGGLEPDFNDVPNSVMNKLRPFQRGPMVA